MNISKSQATLSILGNTPTSFDLDENGNIARWESETKQPSEAEIDAEVIRLQAVYDSQEYARNRKAEYDKLNQFEMQFDDQLNGTTTWVDAINAIKQEFPK